MFTREVAVKSVSGPVGMAQMIDMAAQSGYWTLAGLMSMISINLGILNLMPFPVLDGGMILFLLIEAVMRPRRQLGHQGKGLPGPPSSA